MLAVYSSNSALRDILDMDAGGVTMPFGFGPLAIPWVLSRLLMADGSVEDVDAVMMLCSDYVYYLVFLSGWVGDSRVFQLARDRSRPFAAMV